MQVRLCLQRGDVQGVKQTAGYGGLPITSYAIS